MDDEADGARAGRTRRRAKAGEETSIVDIQKQPNMLVLKAQATGLLLSVQC